MKSRRNGASSLKIAFACAGAASLLFGSAGIANADTGSTGNDDIGSIIEAANPAAVQQASTYHGGAQRSSSDSVRSTLTGGIPADPAEGIVLTGNGSSQMRLGLPFAQQAASSADVGAGMVAYDNQNGSTTVPLVVDAGSLAVHTVINSVEAPQSYEYELGLAQGDQVQQLATGEIVVTDEQGNPEFASAAPWAKDATGASVPTRYELHGSTLVQVVDHDASFRYPVVADPTIGGVYMDRYQWNSAHDRLTIWPTFAGGTFQPGLVLQFGWPELIGATPSANTPTMYQQFGCHTVGNAALWATGQTWDLETWRGTVSDPFAMFGSLCNW